LIVLAAVVALAFAKCTRYEIPVRSMEELTDALKNARPGANITLAPGTYKGSLTITAKGDPSDYSCSIMINGGGKATFTSKEKWAVRFDKAAYIYVEGVEFSDVSDYGVFLVESEGVSIYDCKFSNIDHVGVMIMGGKWNEIEMCHFNYVKENPVWVGFGQDSWQNKIKDCYFEDGLGGDVILLDKNSRNTSVWNNNFKGKHSSFSRWMHVLGDGNWVRGNTFVEDKSNTQLTEGILSEGYSTYYRGNVMTLSASYMYGFNNNGDGEIICLSNVVSGGAQLTNGPVDQTC